MRLRGAAGFTLVEVMIATSITAVIGVLIIGSFQRMHATKEAVEALDERYSVARLALNRMSRELQMAFVSDRYDRKRFRERPTMFWGDDSGERDVIRFTSFAHRRLYRDAKESDQALIEYKVDRDPDNRDQYALIRREKVHLDDDPERGGTEAVLCDDVTGFDVSYWDWKKETWVREWDTNSNDRPAGQLPTRVRLQLKLKMPNGEEKRFETQARLPMVRPLEL